MGYYDVYHRAEVVATRRLTPHLVRVELGGEGLRGWSTSSGCPGRAPGPRAARAGLPDGRPAGDHARRHPGLPRPRRPAADAQLHRPRLGPGAPRMVVDFVVHEGGVASAWAQRARPGDVIYVTEAMGWYRPPADAPWQLLVADLAGLPALARAVEQLPAGARAYALVEVPTAADRLEILTAAERQLDVAGGFGQRRGPEPARRRRWPSSSAPEGPGYVWFAGEASASRAVRKHLRHERGWPVERSPRSATGASTPSAGTPATPRSPPPSRSSTPKPSPPASAATTPSSSTTRPWSAWGCRAPPAPVRPGATSSPTRSSLSRGTAARRRAHQLSARPSTASATGPRRAGLRQGAAPCSGNVRSEPLARAVDAPDVAEGVADLADGGAERRAPASSGGSTFAEPRAAARSCLQRAPGRGRCRGRRAIRADPGGLRGLERRVDPQRLVRLLLVEREPVDPDDDPLAGVDLRATSYAERLDLALLEALLDRRRPRRRAPPPPPSAPAPPPRRRRSATPRRTSRRTGRPSWSGRSRRRAPAGCARRAGRPSGVGSAIASSKELVCSDCVPPSTAASACTVDPDEVDLRLLRGQLHAGGLGVEAQHLRLRVRRAEPLAHHAGPDPPGRPELRHLLQQRRAGRRRRTRAAARTRRPRARRPAPPRRRRSRWPA